MGQNDFFGKAWPRCLAQSVRKYGMKFDIFHHHINFNKKLSYCRDSLRYDKTKNVLRRIENWLYVRQQTVVLNGQYSDWKWVTDGVPQGSVWDS